MKKKLKVGEVFELLGLKWQILKITSDGYMCLASRLENPLRFDPLCNNWESSDLRNYLNTSFYKKLAEVVGEENLIPFERNILSYGGQTYGTCEEKVSILSAEEYKEYGSLIPNVDYFWWTLTPDSIKGEWNVIICPSGNFATCSCDDDGCNIRPLCVFSSEFFNHS